MLTRDLLYISKSTFGKKPYGHLFPQKPPEGSYPNKRDVDKFIPKKDQKIYTGKAGSVIFCDTSGIHRGGYATSKERLMSTFFYSAKTFKEEKRYRVPKHIEADRPLSPESFYALTGSFVR